MGGLGSQTNTVSRTLSAKTGREVYPGASVLEAPLTITFMRITYPTPTGWVLLGSGTDRLSVVDEELRVHGTQGLRIVDASIMPHVPNGNTHSTVCVVASRAADLIFTARLRK
jgi:choline dehydrogenase